MCVQNHGFVFGGVERLPIYLEVIEYIDGFVYVKVLF